MKFLEVRRSLLNKGFQLTEGGKHEKYHHASSADRGTGIMTVVSRASGGADVSKFLKAKMARQLRISKSQFEAFVECTLSEDEYEELVRQSDQS